MLKFEKPEYKVKEYVKSNFYGKFEIEPLERGFGTTLGNALRRVMLSSLPGDAITSVKIDGVAHEFQKIDGVVEDVTAIVLNLKSIVIPFRYESIDLKITFNTRYLPMPSSTGYVGTYTIDIFVRAGNIDILYIFT